MTTDPTVRAIPADELAEAERWARDALERTVPSHLVTLLAEYDRRGAELERLRAMKQRATELRDSYKVGPVGRAVRLILKEA